MRLGQQKKKGWQLKTKKNQTSKWPNAKGIGRGEAVA